MQNDMRDRLVEVIKQGSCHYSDTPCAEECGSCRTIELPIRDIEKLADHLIANGVIVLDMNVISPENRPLITHFADMPLDDVLKLIKNKANIIDIPDDTILYIQDKWLVVNTESEDLGKAIKGIVDYCNGERG